MKDNDFKKLDHVVGSSRVHTRGELVEDGYKPDLTVANTANEILYILECEYKTDRKAFLGDLIKAEKFSFYKKIHPTLVIVMTQFENTTVEQIAGNLRPYVKWLKERAGGQMSLKQILLIEDRKYLDSIRAGEELCSDKFINRCIVL